MRTQRMKGTGLILICVLFSLVQDSTSQCPAGTAFKDDFHYNNSDLWDPSESSGHSPMGPGYMLFPDHCHYNVSEDGWYGLAMALDNVPCNTNPSACGGSVYAGCHLRTTACYSYGTYEVLMRVSHPDGPDTLTCFSVSSVTKTYTDDPTHNEIDICFDSTHTTMHAAYFDTPGNDQEHLKVVDLGFDASLDFHHYSFVWTSSSITWYVDGKQMWVADGSLGKIPWLPQQIVLILRPISTTYDGSAFTDVVYVSYTPL